MELTRKWFAANKIGRQHQNIEVLQVYVWLVTEDNKIILVSKDGNKWQFPGGHPEEGESIDQVAIREVFEETNLKIESHKDELQFFGYYLIENDPQNLSLQEYLQVRLMLKLQKTSSELKLSTNEKLDDKSAVKFIKPCSTEELINLVPWLSNSEELISFNEQFQK